MTESDGQREGERVTEENAETATLRGEKKKTEKKKCLERHEENITDIITAENSQTAGVS